MVRRGQVVVSLATASANDLEIYEKLSDRQQMYLLIIAVVLILFAVIIGVCIGMRKKKRKEETVVKTEQISSMEETIQEDKIYSQYIVGKLHNIGKRSNQQDSFAVSDENDDTLCKEKGLISIVADGMGGLSDGDKISSIVALSLLKSFYEKPLTDCPGNILLEMLKNANKEVNAYLKNKTERCGSTLVTGIIKDKKLYYLSVGDSHIYLYRGGQLILLNKEHTYRDELDVKFVNDEISFREASDNAQKTALTSYIGMGRIEKIDRNIVPLELQSGDRILFMTDGVFGTMPENQIANAMQYPMEESIRRMNDFITAIGKKNQDNYTAVIIECR